MAFSFNLVDQPWIPCVRNDGTLDELGLLETLARAHELRELRGDTPLETAALYRLLIAVLHRVYGPKERGVWLELYKRQELGFEMEPLIGYLNSWQHKFDLFDERAPFFQVADTKQLGGQDTVNKMVMQLTQDATLFQHTLNAMEGGAELTAAQAARALLAFQAFALGYQLFVDGPCAQGAVYLVLGSSLYETLVLNLTRYPEEQGEYVSSADDAPAWEMESPFKVKIEGRSASRDAKLIKAGGKEKLKFENHTPMGQLDYLTWHNRKIKLVPETGRNRIIVRSIAWAPGMRLAKDATDPMQTHIKSESGGWLALKFNPDKALWRDSATLLRIADDPKKYRPVKALQWLATSARLNPTLLPKTFRLAAFGLAKDQAKVELLRAETTPLEIEYLQRDDLLPDVTTALELAEKVGKLLNRCAFLLAWLVTKPTTPDQEFEEPDKTFDEQTRIETKFTVGANERSKDQDAQKAYKLFSSFGVERLYWSGLETRFHRFLQDLPSQPEQAKEEWRQQLRRAARASFKQATACAGTDRRAQRAIVKAEEQFNMGLGYLLTVKAINSNQGGDSHGKN